VERIVEAVLTHATLQTAAKALKVSYTTLWRRMQQPDVAERLREARKDAWGRAMGQLREAGPEAVAALRRTLREAESESVTVSAARTVLEFGLRAVELVDIQERLDTLEQLAKSRQKGPGNDRENQTATRPAGGVNGSA
jgi:hypothetical protein